MRSTYYHPYEYFVNDLYGNAMIKVLLLFHRNLNVLLYVLYQIIDKIYVKVVAQNDADLSCINLNINVLKCFTKAQHLKTLISSLIEDKSVQF